MVDVDDYLISYINELLSFGETMFSLYLSSEPPESLFYFIDRFRFKVACVASVSVWFRSKKRPWKGIFGFDRARNEARTPPRAQYLRHFSRGL